MKTYWFVVRNGAYEGEEFFVEAKDLYEAYDIVQTYWDDTDVECYGTISEAEAEMLGYDTY